MGVPDADRGEVPIAVLAVEGEMPEADLRRRCREELSAFKVPVRFVFRPLTAFPRTATGKVDRRRLREEVTRAAARAEDV